nr:hypothetical protein [Fredinandcohnia onubensis]
MARMLGLNGNTDDELIDSLTDLLRRLNKSLNQPFKLKEFGVWKKQNVKNTWIIWQQELMKILVHH